MQDIPQPQISLPNQLQHERIDEDNIHSEEVKKEANVKAKTTESAQDKSSGNGWFGGIFSKLSLKPKNQMKLPDDKNPTVKIKIKDYFFD